MIICENDFNKFFSGYIETEVQYGYTFFYRFSKVQREYYKSEKEYYGIQSHCPAGVKLSIANCKRVSFDFICKTENEEINLGIITKNGEDKTYKMDKTTGKVDLEFGGADVVLYLSYNAYLGIKNLDIEGDAMPKKEKTIFSFGDSITQGYCTNEPAHTYPMKLSRTLDAEVYNFGISGFYMEKGILNDIELLPKPDMITLAYGTNDWSYERDYREGLEHIFKELNIKYADTPIFIWLPIIRGDGKNKLKFGTLEDVREDIRNEARKYSNFILLEDGMKMDLDSDFMDDLTHPNAKGMRALGELIAAEIKAKI